MLTDTLLAFTRVAVYDHDFDEKRWGKSRDRYFATPEDAQEWIEKTGVKLVNIYRIEKVNGTWRTDWELRK